MGDVKAIRITRLIAVPVVITLAVTILRLIGELAHWPAPLFNAAPGGGMAIVGISWLPIIFGPYFALKLAGAGSGPPSNGKAIMMAMIGLVVFVLGGVIFATTIAHPSYLTAAALLLMLAAAFVPALGWRSLGITLLAYAFAARIPVLVVMYFAMSGNGGAGWGTHYDGMPPALAHVPFGTAFLYGAVMPQMTLWIGFTVVVGAIIGTLVVAIMGRGKQPTQASA